MQLLTAIEDSFLTLEICLDEQTKQELLACNYHDLSHFHFSLGLWIRNHLLESSSSLYHLFTDAGIKQTDDMSWLLIQLFYAYLQIKHSALKVSGVRPLDKNRLWVRFNTGEAKIFDFTPLISTSAFAPLANDEIFRDVYIDYGITVWMDGAIEIAPEALYRGGILVKEKSGRP